ncbi:MULTISPECIES: SURF1 family protein [Sphingomonas]|jgi:surfeit locus 1 family protein|uniref:SURF1-like protein n=1 Tax=Sphingomonas zeae TaxID=1646122 RepID=A0A7Y6B6N0_9SPHN|nr:MULTISPECIES: SURF1 family protein [Sphingomonas]MBB4047710.1 surfeit locus 1 family protein [Sphingomonas zeae]MDK8185584.1 SURF1 family protein [Sphingomonas zeae]MDK8216605.1 SURF1 family protein [Sphingomonas sp. UMB7805-LC452B]NUU47623.1 SURF1 family protein [Sphingomonas zeae]
MADVGVSGGRPGRSPLTLAILTAIGVALIAVFLSLGVWQLQRRVWKLHLIATVEARLKAPPISAPSVASAADAYTRVTAEGRFRNDRETYVQAVTERGPGFWVLTPLITTRFTVLVNRGFVPAEKRADHNRPAGPVRVTGLIRVTEPGGAFLRSNDPVADRWYSRDVAAIAGVKRLGPVAPYFIDADATPNPGGYPVGGLTVVAFRNSHLSYALTWFALAILTLMGMVILWRRGRE